MRNVDVLGEVRGALRGSERGAGFGLGTEPCAEAGPLSAKLIFVSTSVSNASLTVRRRPASIGEVFVQPASRSRIRLHGVRPGPIRMTCSFE